MIEMLTSIKLAEGNNEIDSLNENLKLQMKSQMKKKHPII